VAVFKHPQRQTVQQEADYLMQRLAKNCPYITPRYANEELVHQLAVIDPSLPVYATTAYIYKNSKAVQEALKELWYHVTRFHTDEQLQFSWVFRDLDLRVIDEDYLHNEWMEYVRK